MNIIPKDVSEFQTRLLQAKEMHKRRNQLIELVRQMYYLEIQRSTGFLGVSSEWRTKVAEEYWDVSTKPMNTVNLATAILSGHDPQFKVMVPGLETASITSRAEKFLQGLIRVNSRRQQTPIHPYLTFRTVLDGGAAVRVTWQEIAPPREIRTLEATAEDQQEGKPGAVVAVYPRNLVPINLTVVKLDHVFPMGRSVFSPFRELFHIENRTVADVMADWEGDPRAKLDNLPTNASPMMDNQTREWAEWWGQDGAKVYFAATYDGKYIVEPEEVNYPVIPYVITSYHRTEVNPASGNSWRETVPFLYPILWVADREEYVRSKNLRTIDLFASMLPIHAGGNKPINLSGVWGEAIELMEENETVKFPAWPGNPPDVYRYAEDLATRISEGTFSQAMFGQMSSRVSGYGLAQLIGADTLRSDTPRACLELGWGGIADVVFMLLERHSPTVRVAITTQTRAINLSAMLSGEETADVLVDCFIKPKQPADEVRMATLGAQIAALPRPPVSMAYILENFFGVHQPEDELSAILEEQAKNDPVVRMIAMIQALQDAGSPYAPIIAQQLGTSMQMAMGGGQLVGGPNPGGGMMQAMGGNPPPMEPMGESPTQEAQVWGGPRPEGM